ncbi:hypothetical protein NSQ77_09410 [Oceanobacillus sp. FSL K6-2867]|uniref:hypothetical protein n=1 Tax=Oceanobacillus sp. FSL K6-2867 TaxID=2954748 RepID=UPI0030D98767
MTETAEGKGFAEVMDSLNNEANMESLLYLVNKLPDLAKTVKTADEALTFAQSTLNDKETMNQLFEEAETKLEASNLNTDTLDALFRVLHLLPEVVPLLEKLVDISEFVKEAAKDSDSIEMLLDEVSPITNSFNLTVDVLKETNHRVQADDQLPHVSIFKLLNLLKDPSVRKGYKYVQTLLNVLSEENKKEA